MQTHVGNFCGGYLPPFVMLGGHVVLNHGKGEKGNNNKGGNVIDLWEKTC